MGGNTATTTAARRLECQVTTPRSAVLEEGKSISLLSVGCVYPRAPGRQRRGGSHRTLSGTRLVSGRAMGPLLQRVFADGAEKADWEALYSPALPQTALQENS